MRLHNDEEVATILVRDKLTVLGGTIDVDDRVSWVPPGTTGWQPSNCYLLTEPSGALLVDSGLAVHRDQVLDGLRAALGAHAALSIFFTRGEMDCVSNLEPISRDFDVLELYTGGVVNPFDAFDDVNRMRYKGRRQQIDIRSEGGDSMPRSPRIAIGAQRALEIESPLLRLLPTFWGWDEQTGTMFTSDVFTHGMVDDPARPPVIDETMQDPTTVDDVSGHLVAKYEWLRKATTAPLQDWLTDRFASLQPEIIAPSRGCVLRGRRVVQRHLNLLVSALGTVGA
jgi:hypothetical protein